MSKGSEAFRRLVGWFGLPTETTPRQLCYKDKELVEKELKALEIIKDKRVNCFDVIDSVDYKHYLVLMEEYHKSWRLTKKEYDLLKEVLEDE